MALMVTHAVSDFESWTSAFDAWSQPGPLVEVRREQEPIAYRICPTIIDPTIIGLTCHACL